MIRPRIESVLLACILVLLAYGSALAQVDCYAKWLQNIGDGIRNASAREVQLASQWYVRLQVADDLTARGMIKAAQTSDIKSIVVNLSTDRLAQGGIPFRAATPEENIDEIYRAIGNLTQPTFDGIPGLDGKIGTIVSGSESNQLGALLDLKIADDIATRGVDIRLIEFEESFVVPGTGQIRRYDVTQVDDDLVLGSVVHENKNWPNGLSNGANDPFLRDYADVQFPSDILLHAGEDFRGYRVNLRVRVQELGQDAIVLSELLKKFDDPFIVEKLGGEVLAASKKSLFEDLWNAGQIAEFH